MSAGAPECCVCVCVCVTSRARSGPLPASTPPGAPLDKAQGLHFELRCDDMPPTYRPSSPKAATGSTESRAWIVMHACCWIEEYACMVVGAS